MELNFTKYEGAGNDFILLDGREPLPIELTQERIQKLCDRRFGIGADGLMVLENGNDEVDFSMAFYNSDGKAGSMCGNGGRCIVAFAHHLGIGGSKKTFTAPDGIHHGEMISDNVVKLSMANVEKVFKVDDGWFTDTGSPHVLITDDSFEHSRAKRLRQMYDSNINYIFINGERIKIRTFERGVEDETLACGTGAVASAITAAVISGDKELSEFRIEARGGELVVNFKQSESGFEEITLTGEANMTFKGKI